MEAGAGGSQGSGDTLTTCASATIEYTGERDEEGRCHGRGTAVYADDGINNNNNNKKYSFARYEGTWHHGTLTGTGTLTYRNGDRCVCMHDDVITRVYHTAHPSSHTLIAAM